MADSVGKEEPKRISFRQLHIRLPRDLWLMIHAKLSFSTLFALHRVCRDFNDFYTLQEKIALAYKWLTLLNIKPDFICSLFPNCLWQEKYRVYHFPSGVHINEFERSVQRAKLTDTTLLRNIYRKLRKNGQKMQVLLTLFYNAKREEDRHHRGDLLDRTIRGELTFNYSLSNVTDDVFHFLFMYCANGLSLKVVREDNVENYRRYLSLRPEKCHSIKYPEFDRIIYADSVEIMQDLIENPPVIKSYFYPPFINDKDFPEKYRRLCNSVKCIVSEAPVKTKILNLFESLRYEEVFLEGKGHLYLATELIV